MERVRNMPKISEAERLFYGQIGWRNLELRKLGLSELELPTKQYKFCSTRKWTADFAWIKKRIILEIEGGIWTNGRHVRGGGFEKDCEKYNWATLHGWKVFRVPTDWVKSDDALNLIEEILK